MSEVVDVISCSKGSNQVESSFLDDDANSKSKSKLCAVKLNDKDDECQRLKFNYNDNDIDMDVKARNWIGALVNKEFDNQRYMGEVVKYRGQTKLFKVDYENYVSEEVDYQELQKIVSPPPVVCQYLETTNPRWFSEMEKKKKKRLQKEDTWIPIHPRYHSSTYQKRVKPRKKKCKKETGTSTYVPLAFRETKKDAYVYY